MLKRGFEATWTIKGAGSNETPKTVVTRGDISYTTSKTEIEVKNAASNMVRYIPGMESTTFSVQVQAGTDPEDAAGVDAYSSLKTFFEEGEVFISTFTSPGGFTRETNMVITSWEDSDPVDGLNTANITLRVAAAEAGTKFYGTSSGSGSGT